MHDEACPWMEFFFRLTTVFLIVACLLWNFVHLRRPDPRQSSINPIQDQFLPGIQYSFGEENGYEIYFSSIFLTFFRLFVSPVIEAMTKYKTRDIPMYCTIPLSLYWIDPQKKKPCLPYIVFRTFSSSSSSSLIHHHQSIHPFIHPAQPRLSLHSSSLQATNLDRLHKYLLPTRPTTHITIYSMERQFDISQPSIPARFWYFKKHTYLPT